MSLPVDKSLLVSEGMWAASVWSGQGKGLSRLQDSLADKHSLAQKGLQEPVTKLFGVLC